MAPEAPHQHFPFRCSSCSSHNLERRRPLLGAQSSNEPPGFSNNLWLFWQWVGTIQPFWASDSERGACPAAELLLRESWLSACLPLAHLCLLLHSWLTLYREDLPASTHLSSNFFFPRCLSLCGKAYSYSLLKRLSKSCLPLQPSESPVSGQCVTRLNESVTILHSLGKVAKCFWVSPDTVLICEHPKLKPLPLETTVKSTGSRTQADVQNG